MEEAREKKLFGNFTFQDFEVQNEDDESGSLQQSSRSKYAPSQLQQNNFGPKYTQSQLGSRSLFKTF